MANTTASRGGGDATAPSVATPRADDRRDGCGRSDSPLSSKETEDCHSHQGRGELETHTGLQAQVTPPPGRGRASRRSPGCSGATAACGSAEDSLPTLAKSSLAGSAGQAVDSSSLRFLAAAVLRQRKEEEKKDKEQAKRQETQPQEPAALERARLFLERNKRKKRLPKTSSSRPSCRAVLGQGRRRPLRGAEAVPCGPDVFDDVSLHGLVLVRPFLGPCCDSGGSYFPCFVDLDFTENNNPCFKASTWHIAREGSDCAVTVHTGSTGTVAFCCRQA